jgi:hypothetical protein
MDEDFGFLEEYRHRTIKWRDALLFPPDVAVEVVSAFKHRDMRLLGIDVFGSSANGEYKCLDEKCLDFSQKKYWDCSAQELCEIAADHIQSDNDFLFEFIEP